MLLTQSLMRTKKGLSHLITKRTARRWNVLPATKVLQPKLRSTKKRLTVILAKVVTKQKAAPPSATIATKNNPHLKQQTKASLSTGGFCLFCHKILKSSAKSKQNRPTA